jgi:hypothetical protein
MGADSGAGGGGAAATIALGLLAFAEDTCVEGGAVLTVAAGGLTAAEAGAACIVRLSITVLTPAIWATSAVAMVRAVSLVTLPFSVTTPEETEAWIACPLRFRSAARLLATFAFRLASSVAGGVLLQPARSIAIESEMTAARGVANLL